MSDAHLHRAQRRASTEARLRRHRWSSLVVVAAVVLGFGGSRLFREDPNKPVAVEQQPGMRSTVTIDTKGSLQITQRLTFDTPRSSLTVSIPMRSSPDNLFDPRIDDLRLRVKSQDAAELTGSLTKGEIYTFRLPARTASAELTYSAQGVTSHSRPSVAGRVLALVTPLAIDRIEDLTSRIEIEGAGVLNVGCRQSRRPMTTCGTGSDKAWVVERAANDPVDVFAQVDLPTTP